MYLDGTRTNRSLKDLLVIFYGQFTFGFGFLSVFLDFYFCQNLDLFPHFEHFNEDIIYFLLQNRDLHV